jgi:DNA ligase (NAD+)
VEHLEGETAWFCVNAGCPAQLVRRVEHFVSRGAMDIDGLGIKIVEQLISTGQVKDVGDLYALTVDDLLNLDGFAEKKARNLISAIESSKRQPLARLITALGIRGSGEVASIDLASHFGSLEKLSVASSGELQKIEGIGPNTAQGIVDWFAREGNRIVLFKLKRAGLRVEEAEVSSQTVSGKFSGMTFVITGTLPTLGRDEASELIRKNGGKVTDSVSRNTNYLVLGENPGSKYEKAKGFGIQIIDEAELRRLAA